MSTVPGDPVSTSALGGALRSHALRLAAAAEQLAGAARRSGRHGGPDSAVRERELMTGAAEQLDRIGSLLQSWATDVVEETARVRGIAAESARTDLRVEGHHVLEAPGPSRADPLQRLEARERLQHLLNRVTAQDSRTRARLQRELEASATVLAKMSRQARGEP